MRRILFLLPVLCSGCLYLPVADVLDRVHPSPVRPEYDNVNPPPLPVPAPGSVPAGTILPPQPALPATPNGPETAPQLAPIQGTTPFAPEPSLPNT
ncbi:MAG TPA: hypothetical protein VKS79_06905 [Gemmataceae bacterium]|nr:hypothetical protein [Gemmataceae bacterium]